MKMKGYELLAVVIGFAVGATICNATKEACALWPTSPVVMALTRKITWFAPASTEAAGRGRAAGRKPVVAGGRADSLVRAALPGVLNVSCPAPGLATAGQPGPDAWPALAKLGYRTVVDLRQPDEPRGHDEPALVSKAGLRYVTIPLDAGTLGAKHFDRFRALMRDPKQGPVFVHCASANRVGPLVAAWLVLDQGVAEDEAIARAKALGMRSPLLEQKTLAYVRSQQPER